MTVTISIKVTTHAILQSECKGHSLMWPDPFSPCQGRNESGYVRLGWTICRELYGIGANYRRVYISRLTNLAVIRDFIFANAPYSTIVLDK